jgi:hypothetical protein
MTAEGAERFGIVDQVMEKRPTAVRLTSIRATIST